MSVDYIDMQSQIMRRVFVIRALRRLREPLTGSLFLLGVALMLLFSAVSTVSVFLNAWRLPTLIESLWYVAQAAITTEVSVQLILATVLAAGLYLGSRALMIGVKMCVKVIVRSVHWTKVGVRRVTTSLLAGRIVIG